MIEMLTVVGIISVLVSVSIPIINSSLKKAQEATDAANERAAKGAALTEYLSTGSMGEADTNGYSYFDNAAGKWTAAPPSAGYGKCEVHKHKGGYLRGQMIDSEVNLVWINESKEEVRALCSVALMADASGGGSLSIPEEPEKYPGCDFTVQGTNLDETVSFSAGVLTIKEGADVTIRNKSGVAQTAQRIVVADGTAATTIRLDGINIDVGRQENVAAFEIADNSTGDVTIILNGTSINTLKSGTNCAGLQKSSRGAGIGRKLAIQGDGSLEAIGNDYGAGIGGGKDASGNNIEISGGKVIATGGSYYGAGIGGCGSGNGAGGSHISILGGEVKVRAFNEAAGIGGDIAGDGSDITIKDCKVTIYTSQGAGIGGGVSGIGRNIRISGSEVTVISGADAIGCGDSKEGQGTDIFVNGSIYSPQENKTTYITPSGVTYEESSILYAFEYHYLRVSGPKSNEKVAFNNTTGVLTIKDGAEVTISSTGSGNTNKCRIELEENANADITLDGICIDMSANLDTAAFKIADNSKGNVTITFYNRCELISGTNCAGLQKNGTGAGIGTLTIKCGSFGSFTAKGGSGGAGIGGGAGKAGSNITIKNTSNLSSDKTMTVTSGGSGAADIGGGSGGGTGSNITINGKLYTSQIDKKTTINPDGTCSSVDIP